MFTGNRHGTGKRWLLIALIVLGGFWLVNDAYHDGYYDALVQTGQITGVRHYGGGPHFPWGLLILGGIAYVAWRKGAFDRFGGPGGPFGPGAGERGGQQPGGGGGPAFRGPRAFFDEWHRQAHAADQPAATRPPVPAVPQPPATPPSPPTAGGASGNGMPPAAPGTPAPTPPAPDYWATMPGPAGAPVGESGTSTTATPVEPAPPASERGSGPASGPVLERW